jgi:hypothetical protein
MNVIEILLSRRTVKKYPAAARRTDEVSKKDTATERKNVLFRGAKGIDL